MSRFGASEPKFLFEVSGTELKVVDFTVHEEISSPYIVHLSLASEDEINLEDVISKEAFLKIFDYHNDINRYFHGIIFQFTQIGSRGRFLLYKAVMVPSIRLLLLEQDCRIFQEKNVVDIVQQILKDGNIQSDRFEFRVRSEYKPKEYCVQYRETDLNFISRLLEEEGIYYFFEHSEDKHILVFADCTTCHKPIDGSASVLYHPMDEMVPEEEVIYSFTFSRQIHSGKCTLKDFNFEKPSLDLTAKEESNIHQNIEVYDYPGRYSDESSGKGLARVRLQELGALKEKAKGKSACPRLTPGYTFSLTDHECPDFNKEYLILGVTHRGVQPQVLEEIADSGKKFSYHNEFTGIPSSVPFRPKRRASKSFVKGVQTAIVVGPQGEEIHTDKHGRVKAQFHWDREGKKDEKSSCWIRVSQVSAGAGWGGIDIPRIGHEVIVDFIEGDPDRPIIIGRVYHGENRPPLDLPGGGMVSGSKSNSTPGGGGYNEMTMNDTKGEEKMTIHAQYDMSTTVEHDQTNTVNNKLTETIKSDATIKITEGNYNHDVVAGKATYHIQGALAENYDATQDTKVKGNLTIKSTGGTIAVSSDSAHVQIDAATNIKLHTGASTIEMDSGGNIKIDGINIEINGVNVSVNGSGSITIKGGIVHSEAQSQHQTKGAIVISEGSATNTVKGGMVMLNP